MRVITSFFSFTERIVRVILAAKRFIGSYEKLANEKPQPAYTPRKNRMHCKFDRDSDTEKIICFFFPFGKPEKKRVIYERCLNARKRDHENVYGSSKYDNTTGKW